MKQNFQPGDYVIYRKSKHSTQPGPRATNVQPSRRGDTYVYNVDKFWIVEEVQEDGTIIASTRRGKRNAIKPDDPSLKRANLLERILYRSRFAALDEVEVSVPAQKVEEFAAH